MTEGRWWALRLPLERPPLNLNRRLHHMQEYRLKREVREATAWLARQARIPQLARVRVTLEWQKGDHRTADADNMALTLKPAIDGLRDAGVLTDDTGKTVESGQRITYPDQGVRRIPQLMLLIEEIRSAE